MRTGSISSTRDRGKTYVSKTLPNKYGPAVRIVSTIIEGKEGGQQFAKIKDEIVLRMTHLERQTAGSLAFGCTGNARED